MVTSGDGQTGEASPPYRVFEPIHVSFENGREHINISSEARRLFWAINGPLETSIQVKQDASNFESLTPYFDSTTSAWHAISQASMFEPKISSITVHVEAFERWESNWLEFHEHSEYPEDCMDDAEWGPLPEWDDPEGDEEQLHLLSCCGEQRPQGKGVSMLVEAAPGAYVTVHDYLSTVHPWLMDLRGEILAAAPMSMLETEEPLPEETELVVLCTAPEELWFEIKAEWVEGQRRKATIINNALEGERTESGRRTWLPTCALREANEHRCSFEWGGARALIERIRRGTSPRKRHSFVGLFVLVQCPTAMSPAFRLLLRCTLHFKEEQLVAPALLDYSLVLTKQTTSEILHTNVTCFGSLVIMS